MDSLKPSAARVQEQLSRIFASPQFRDAPRLQTFLQFIISLTLDGKTDQIKETTISAEVFRRADMADDSIVRSAARRLRTKLEEYYRDTGIHDEVWISVPKGSYVPEIEARGAGHARVFPGDSPAPPPIAPQPVVPLATIPQSRPNHARFYTAAIVFCLAGASIGGWLLRGVSSRPLPSSAHSRAENPVAHDFVIKGRFDLQRSTPEAVRQAEEDFQHAIDVDPGFGLAYVELARAKMTEARARGSIYRTESERNSAAELSRKALQLDPALPEAHAILAELAMQYDWDWTTAERELNLALLGPPSATAELRYASFLIFHGRFAEADPRLRRAQELEPFDTGTMLSLSAAWYLEGRFAQVREISQRILATYPTLPDVQASAAGIYIWEGQPKIALAALAKIEKPFPALPFYEAMAHARAGHREEALRLIHPYEEKYPNIGVALEWIAKVYAVLGDEPNTTLWLQRSADRREWQALTIAVNPIFAPMENSPGFLKLKKRMGLP